MQQIHFRDMSRSIGSGRVHPLRELVEQWSERTQGSAITHTPLSFNLTLKWQIFQVTNYTDLQLSCFYSAQVYTAGWGEAAFLYVIVISSATE